MKSESESIVSICFRKRFSGYSIRAGSTFQRSGGTIVRPKRIIQHEKFNLSTLDFDFALVKLSKPLTFSDKIQPIALINQDKIIEDGTNCLVSGWGR